MKYIHCENVYSMKFYKCHAEDEDVKDVLNFTIYRIVWTEIRIAPPFIDTFSYVQLSMYPDDVTTYKHNDRMFLT